MTEKIETMQNIGFESANKIEKINSDIKVAVERQENNNKSRIWSLWIHGSYKTFRWKCLTELEIWVWNSAENKNW